ncbi:MAG: tetratricopeptide repeat protein [Candidatus Acidiferrales bacterium]
MRSKKILWMAVALALLMVPVASWLGAGAAAQGGNSLTGEVYDVNGKAYPNVELFFTSEDNGHSFTVQVDEKGHYHTPALVAGTYDVDVKDKGQVVFRTGVKISGGSEMNWDIKVVVSDAQKKAAEAQAEQQKAFQNLKTNFDAGVASSTQAETLHAQLAKGTGDQSALQSQIAQASEAAIQDFQNALQGMKDTDTNRPIVLSRIAAAYDLEGKSDQAANYYQQAIALQPNNAGYYNNLGNALAAMGKTDDAMAAYSKSADLDPANAASAWRNAGATLYNAGKMKEAAEPFQKSLAIDPKNAQTWFLLGQCLMNTMGSKQEGDKIIPVIQPGTVEAFQKAVALDPGGTWGTQAQQDLDALQAMGLGIDTKIKNNTKGKS